MQVATPEAEEAKGKEKTEHTGTPAESQPSESSLSYHDFPELDDETEVLEIVEDMGDIIGCLLRLSISIRNPAPHDHFMSSKFTDTSHFEEYDVEHVKAKLPRVEPCLASRLGKAVSRRRQYFKYRETHHQKLNAGLDTGSKRSEAGPQSTVASSIPTALKEGGSSHPAFSRVEEEELSNSGASQTSYATSGPQSGRLKIPSLPKQASDGPFECPYCYMIISVSTTIQWKKHVNADLRPYICLEPDCLTPEQQYTRRHEWLHHMNRKHWRVFRCPYSCQEEDFTSPSRLQYHVRQFHPELSSQRDLTIIFDLCERPGPWSEETKCPLCQQALYSKREYARHVGRHQTELALFALPFNGEEEEEEEEEEEDDPDDPKQSNRRKYTTEDWSDSPESDQSDDHPVPSHAPEYPVQVPHPPKTSARDHPLYKNASPKADGLFHCPWEGQASCNHKPEKLKCNYDKFVDAHLKPYRCKVCKDARFSSTATLLRHEREAHAMHGHGDKPYLCTYEGCERAIPGNGFLRMWNVRDHMRRVHNYTGNYTGNLASIEADFASIETDFKRMKRPRSRSPV
ncbi:hypothetical protein F5B21DRAFT_415916 [Xylaria acuta]|nr:hypothetical protein F5B21DRAFT_415916 [Xylaria acuta]